PEITRRDGAGRDSVVGVIEQVGEGAFELEELAFHHVELLLHFGGDVLGAGSHELSRTDQAEASDVVGWNGEGAAIEPFGDGALFGWHVAVTGSRVVRPVVGAGIDIGAAGIGAAAGDRRKERPGLEKQYARKLPAAHYGVGQARRAREELHPLAHRKRIAEGREPAVASRGRDVAVIQPEIETIGRHGSILAGKAG